MNDNILKQLDAFIEKDKFSDSEWSKRGLNPSSADLCDKMNALFNECCTDLKQLALNNSTQKELSKALTVGLNRFKIIEYDTEEKEFIGDYIYELGQILEIDIENNINKWMYGSLTTAIMKVAKIFKRQEHVIQTLSQDCTKCGSKLETYITKRQEDLPDFAYDVVKCKSCQEFNLIDKGHGIHSLRFGEYEVVEQLLKDEYTKEQAETRLEQIKHWRK